MPTENERLARIETLVGEMHRTLLGNGQPGAIDKLDARVEKVETRVGKIEAWHWKVVGGLIVIGALLGIVEAWAR